MRLKHNVPDFRSAFDDLTKSQVPFASALALNDTGKDVVEAERGEMDDVFDAPTPFTKRGLFQVRANKKNLRTRIGLKRIQAHYLQKQVTGGIRRPTGRALLVPVKARLNKYGNLPRTYVGRTLGKGSTFVASRGNAKTKHLRSGIYRRPTRKGQSLELLIAFEDMARYRKRLEFHPVALKTARRRFDKHFARRFKEALASAR